MAVKPSDVVDKQIIDKPEPDKPPEPEPRRAPVLTAVRTDTPPKLDGRLDDDVWTKAHVETDFTQNFPDEGKPPTERTELRVLYDDSAMYIAVRCFDSRPEDILARMTRRDRDIDADKITIDISSKNDKASAFHFQVNAAGVELDGIRFDDTSYGSDWDARWYSSTSRDDQGWATELKIPLVTLRYNGDVTSFGFQVRRYLGRRQEIDEWSYIPRTAKGEVSYYGTLDGITGLRAKRLAELLIYDSRGFTFRTRQDAFDDRDTTNNFGADLKLGITPALTLDATVNPDFGTVEVDKVVLNLSTVETYFPEKRPFFVEGADLFATRFNLFYSRRVGATPPGPTLAGDSALLEPLPNGRVWTAAKLTGLLPNRVSIAVLDAITSRQDAVISRNGAASEKLLVEPLSNFGVLRLRKEFGNNSSVGMTTTAVNRFEPTGAAAPQPGDLCPVPYSTTFTTLVAPPPRDGRCTNDAYTGGIDVALRSSDGEWAAFGQLIGSRIENGPTQLIPDGTTIGAGSTGWGISTEAGRYGGKNWLYRFGYSNSSPTLQINDAGFQEQANFHDVVGSVMWRTTQPTKRYLSASLEAFVELRRDWRLRDNLNTDAHVTGTVQLPSFWTITALASPYYPRWVENRETGDGARTQRDPGLFYLASVSSNPQKSLVVNFSGHVIKAYDALTAWQASATISLRPIPALELDLIPNFNWQYNGPRWVTTETNMDGSRTYFFAKLNAKSFDVTLRGTYALTRKLSLQAYLQPFVASGHYTEPSSSTAMGEQPFLSLESFVPATLPGGLNPDFRNGSLNLNLFMRWEYLPLSAFWIVYTRNQLQTPYDPAEGPGQLKFDAFRSGPATDVVLLKLSYLWY